MRPTFASVTLGLAGALALVGCENKPTKPMSQAPGGVYASGQPTTPMTMPPSAATGQPTTTLLTPSSPPTRPQ